MKSQKDQREPLGKTRGADASHGHRDRLRRRFFRAGRDALTDHELLELLLTYSIPRKDTQPTAVDLASRFGGLSGVLVQPAERLMAVGGVGESTAVLIALARSLVMRSMEGELESGSHIAAPEDVEAYVRLALGCEPRECVLILCLNASNRLVRHAVIAEGTVNQAPVYPREVAKLALESGATAVILVHNHPGGQCRPSSDDLDLTERLRDMLVRLDIHLHDHLIVTAGGVWSIVSGRRVDGARHSQPV